MADITDLVIQGAQGTAAKVGQGATESYAKGAELAQHAEGIQLKKQAALQEQQKISDKAGMDFLQAIAATDNIKDPQAQNNYLKLLQTRAQVLSQSNSEIAMAKEHFNFISSTPEMRARMQTMINMVERKDITLSKALAAIKDEQVFSALPLDQQTVLKQQGITPENYLSMTADEKDSFIAKAGVAAKFAIEQDNKDGRAALQAGAKAGQQGVNNFESLRKEIQNAPVTTTTRQLADSYDKIRGIVTKKPSAAGDISLVFAYMKMLDPGSTVREGEQAQARQAAGVPEQILNQYNKIVTGENLTPSQRKDFLGQATSLYRTQYAKQQAYNKSMEEVAKQTPGANPRLAFAGATFKAPPPEASSGKTYDVGGQKMDEATAKAFFDAHPTFPRPKGL